MHEKFFEKTGGHTPGDAEPICSKEDISVCSLIYFEFPIGFDEALEYKKANGQYLRHNQWQDLTVHVYI